MKTIELEKPFINHNGVIQNLLVNEDIGSVALITSVKGAVRSNHWHETLSHWLYCISGEFEYWERTLDQTANDVKPLIVKEGQMVYTRPKTVHKTVFTENTVLLSIVKKDRDVGYSDDSVSMEF